MGLLAHLPDTKQRQLRTITRLLCAAADIEFVILFGSHARGDWVEDPATGYRSDFDILVLVATPELAGDHDVWDCCQDRARLVAGDTPVSILVHTVADVNQQLAKGSPFFREVISEGLVLFDAGRAALAAIEPLTPEQYHELAVGAFQHFLGRAVRLLASAERSRESGWFDIAAFELHQAAEFTYKAVLLVFTGYLPKSHDLRALGQHVARVAPHVGPLVPLDVPEHKRLTALLCAAYVEARYSMSFAITAEELTVLGRCVAELRKRAEMACKAKLVSLAAEITTPDDQ